MADPARAEWIGLQDALQRFVLAESTEGSSHIKPLHWYVASRLVIEGGFHPDEIVPRPPFTVDRPRLDRNILQHVPEAGGSGERTVLGGLKTKDVDVVVTKDGIGPCIAVSMKGALKAFRNLTNRMEEAVADCTNLHITYPALVYGFWSVIRANRAGVIPSNSPLLGMRTGRIDQADVALLENGRPAEAVLRYHQALANLSGRDGIRDDPSRYEAVAITLADAEEGRLGEVAPSYPDQDSPLLLDQFFSKIYREYDLRFVYQAPALVRVTRRLVWDPESPALRDPRIGRMVPHISG